jgi:hypothetical protein
MTALTFQRATESCGLDHADAGDAIKQSRAATTNGFVTTR